MPAEGNVGLAFGLVAAAGAATMLGAAVVFCASLAKPIYLAASLGFAAGVMLYVSFAEIFLRKSIQSFEDANYSDVEAYRYSTLAFFGGFVIIFVLDQIVHVLIDWMVARRNSGMACSHSEVILLSHNTAGSAAVPHGTRAAEAAAAEAAVSAVVPPDAACSSRCPPSPMAPVSSPNMTPDPEEGGSGGADGDSAGTSAAGDAAAGDGANHPETPPLMEMLKKDPHTAALEKMGILTAFAIFLHNLPEGLATFVSALSDTSVGIGIAVAIAMHNIPEGICVAMPIYYATGSRWKGFMWAALSGMSEPLGALIGWLALYGDTSLSFAIVFALVAGMMVYISIKELIPMALRYDPRDRVATTSVVVGMAVMAGSLLLFTL